MAERKENKRREPLFLPANTFLLNPANPVGCVLIVLIFIGALIGLPLTLR